MYKPGSVRTELHCLNAFIQYMDIWDMGKQGRQRPGSSEIYLLVEGGR